VTLLIGDCIEQMRTLEADSVDAIVTDPPYGLEFMGKEWDGFGTPLGFQTWSEQWAREALRVLKPGGHLLAFGGTRMYHRLAAGIEDAGFEIRDTLMWLYGSGFPKSLDVSKAIDKRRDDGNEIESVRSFLYKSWKASGVKAETIDSHFGFKGSMSGPHWFYKTSQNTVPTCEQWLGLKNLLNLSDEMDEQVWRLNGRKGNPGEGWTSREITGQHQTAAAAAQWMSNYGIEANLQAKEKRENASTEGAKKWQGWGTALKPAVEPIVLARKPLIGTVAANVLTHGTGALNIDASRIGTEQVSVHNAPKGTFAGGEEGRGSDTTTYRTHTGRWPANILLDEEAAALLDEQSGVSKSQGGRIGKKEHGSLAIGAAGVYEKGDPGFGDTGGASRFFYVAKASRAERNAGLERNIHPTVKPVALMKYLIRLVVPKGGVVLDPFLGSGTTAVAAIEEGVEWIGCEREPEYLEIIKARVAAAQPGFGLTLDEAQG